MKGLNIEWSSFLYCVHQSEYNGSDSECRVMEATLTVRMEITAKFKDKHNIIVIDLIGRHIKECALTLWKTNDKKEQQCPLP